MAQALIGYTGFVGSNLDRQMAFTHRYNSSNISSIENENFDLLICAGVAAKKWLANAEPEKDKKGIDDLLKHLQSIQCRKLVLISTIDVYPAPLAVDETTVIDVDLCSSYGRNRLLLERTLSNIFDTTIIRLPGLFGTGLKKNVIYDFLNNHNIDQIHPGGVFQFYCLTHLARDIAIAMERDIRILNITAEPVHVEELAMLCRDARFANPGIETVPASYDVRSVYADLFGGRNGYLYSKQQVLNDLQQYVNAYRVAT